MEFGGKGKKDQETEDKNKYHLYLTGAREGRNSLIKNKI